MLLVSGIAVVIMMGTMIVWYENFSEHAYYERVYKIYAQIIASTGQTQDALPLVINDEMIENAYNDGSEVVIYRGLIYNAKSWDEIAFVLGHEVAHGMLGHLGKLNTNITDEISVLEANADKMGAFYMMKSGYNICEARKMWKRWTKEKGNYLGLNHPDYSYRYEELNIGCGND